MDFRNHDGPRRAANAARERLSGVRVGRMKMLKKALGFAVLLGSAVSAQAADMGYRQPYTVNQPLDIYSWAGPYLGVNVGYGWGSVSNSGANPSGFSGGIQGGYNWQFGTPWVIGIEADLQASGADDRFASWKFSNPWYGTVRGRVGYAFTPNLLVYGTGGLAFGELKTEIPGFSESNTSAGWTAGIGAEFMLTKNLSAKAEYLYVDLNSNNFVLTNASNGLSFSTVRVGVNYHF